MTTHDDVTCEAFRAHLTAYLEGETDDDARRALERHAQRCVECGALLADLETMRADAARLPELAPTRDLWSGIAARIEAPVVPIAAALPASVADVPRRWNTRRVRRAALIAASLVGAVGLGYYAAATRTPAVALTDSAMAELAAAPADSLVADSTVETRAGAPSEAATVSAQLAVATLAADYDREITRLRRLVDERRSQLDPATIAVIEKNLRVIDAAIADSRGAIAQDPASRFLIESLNQSLETKVELLRIAAALPSRT